MLVCFQAFVHLWTWVQLLAVVHIDWAKNTRAQTTIPMPILYIFCNWGWGEADHSVIICSIVSGTAFRIICSHTKIPLLHIVVNIYCFLIFCANYHNKYEIAILLFIYPFMYQIILGDCLGSADQEKEGPVLLGVQFLICTAKTSIFRVPLGPTSISPEIL